MRGLSESFRKVLEKNYRMTEEKKDGLIGQPVDNQGIIRKGKGRSDNREIDQEISEDLTTVGTNLTTIMTKEDEDMITDVMITKDQATLETHTPTQALTNTTTDTATINNINNKTSTKAKIQTQTIKDKITKFQTNNTKTITTGTEITITIAEGEAIITVGIECHKV